MLRTMQKARYDAGEPRALRPGGAELHALHVADPPLSRPGRAPRCCASCGTRTVTDERREELDEELPEVARHTSEMERRADEAERELLQWKKVRFMADKVGDEFDGYITGVAAFGLFVELVEHYVEGLVHVSTMADDYYRFLEQAHALRGENTQEDLPARRQGARAGHPRQHGAAADRSGARDILEQVRQDERRRGPQRSTARPKKEQRKGTGRSSAASARRSGPASTSGKDASGKRAMTHLVVGTAGHIDHGKSALVQALTGTDPDRLKEEKARGITIELGFAHTDDRRHARRVRRRARATSGSSRTCWPASAASTACCWSSPPTSR